MAETDAVVVDRKLSKADYFRVLMGLTLRKWYVVGLILAAAVLLVIGSVLDVYPVLFIFIFVFIVAYAPMAGLKLIFDKRNQSVFLPVRLTFTEAEIAVASELSRGTLSWDAYRDWKKIGRFYVLVVSGRTSHLVPAAGLSERETERLETLFRTKIKDHR